jgi:phospholipid N-methyltransferase
MYATYRLRADELNEEFIQILRDTYKQREIIILSREDYDEEMVRIKHNMEFTEKLQQRIRAIDEGRSIKKTMAELEGLANG